MCGCVYCVSFCYWKDEETVGDRTDLKTTERQSHSKSGETKKRYYQGSSIKDACRQGGGWFKCGQLRMGRGKDLADVCKLVFSVSLFQYVLQVSFMGDAQA